MLMVHDHFNEIPTLSNAESGTGWNEENTVHYETLAALKSCNPDQPKIMDDKSSQKTLNKPMFTNSTTKCSYQHSPGQNTTSNDVIDLKSFRVNSTNPNITPQSWNLPTRNSFTSYAKPLPAIPKTICS
ncbi:Hypothetical predicted protein [Octopus vulgaris]|uniref:Uncharacterized protein n=2 Tax=Octopus TaxID=6643 RepID=A0AA36FCQ1_OCTVU|nr:Hypothetical predicted protein [Octopus vulgaris]